MSTLLHIAIGFALLTGVIAHGEENPAATAGRVARKSGELVLPYFETREQILAMGPCKATVESTHGCYAVFTMKGGQKFTIGSPGNTPELDRFIAALKEGEICALPDAFRASLKKPRE